MQTIQDEKAIKASELEEALHTEDADLLRMIASTEEDDEFRSSLFQLARRWDKEDWAYDEAIGN